MNVDNFSLLYPYIDFLVVYVIVAMVAILSVIGGLIWAVFVIKKRRRIEETHQPLLDTEDEEETIDNIMHKKRKFYKNNII